VIENRLGEVSQRVRERGGRMRDARDADGCGVTHGADGGA
jgi:hypothetical protein